MKKWLLPAAIILEIALFTAIASPDFKSTGGVLRYFQQYLGDLIGQAAPLFLLALGMTLIMSTGGIDLSAGSAVALIACVMSLFPGDASFWWMAIPTGLALGLALGLINGTLVAGLNIPPIIATLGTMILYRGLCYFVLGDTEQAPFIDVPGYSWFGKFLGSLALLLLTYGAGGFFLTRSAWLRELLMIGGNRVAARYAAIPTQRRLLEVYVVTGALAFLAALCFSSRNSSVSASSLSGLELQVIVATVLGGTQVQGGNASLAGTFFGVLMLAILEEGLRGAAIWGDQYLPFKISHFKYVLLGLFLVVAVWAKGAGKRG